MSSYLAAVAWPYANGPRHIGHVSGFGIPSDVFSRYMRMAGHEVLMVSGTDEHGTPILVEAEKEGVSPRELADRYNRVIAEDLVALGLSYDLFTRTTTRNHYAVAQELFRTVHRNGYMIARDHPRRHLPVDRPHPARPLHRGHLSDLRLRGRTRRPVRQLRQPARPGRPDQPAQPDQRRDSRVRRDRALLPRSAGAGQHPRRMAQVAFGLATQRTQVLAEPARRHPSPGDDARHRLGHPGAAARAGRTTRTSACTSGSTRSSDISLPRSNGPADTATRRRPGGAGGSRTPMASPTTSWARTTSRSTAQIWPAELLAYNGEGDKGGEPGPLGKLALPTEVVSSEYLTMEGRKFSSSRRIVIYVRDFLSRYDADALRYFVAVAGPETTDTDFTWAEFLRRNNDELVAGLGQPGEPVDLDGGQELRRDPAGGRPDRRRQNAARLGQGRFREGWRPDRAPPAEGRHRRGDAGGRRGEQVPLRPGALEDQGRPRPGWGRSCTWHCRWSATATCC